MKKNILFVHQSAELYGSDRVLLAHVTRLNREKYFPIVIVPFDGPLVKELQASGIECHVLPITRLSRATLSLRGMISLPFSLISSIRAISRILSNRQIDLVHSNTLAILSGAGWARWHCVPHIWHVHEIILRPIIVRKLYAILLKWFADCIICVSNATRANLLQDNSALDSKIQVVWNGLECEPRLDESAVRKYRNAIKVDDNELLVALVGRINRWKGQGILVEAANILWQQGVRNIKYLIVGSAPEGQAHFLHELQSLINNSPARDSFTLQGFTPNISLVWGACDIAVIPSTEPEPFGMVALEAMAASKPVIAAKHGGLAEIVIDEETGLLVAPNDPSELAVALQRLISDTNLRRMMGNSAELRYTNHFTLDRYISEIESIYAKF